MRALNKIIDPAEMDRKIQLHSPTVSRSSSGEAVESWALDSTVRAKKEYGRQKSEEEGEINHQETSIKTITWTIRKNPNTSINTTWKIFDTDGLEYLIEGIPEEIGRGRFLAIKTTLIE